MRGLFAAKATSGGPSLSNFLFFATSTPCVVLQSLANELQVREGQERGTFAIAWRLLLLDCFGGIGAGSLSLEDSAEEVGIAAGGSKVEGPLLAAGASGEVS